LTDCQQSRFKPISGIALSFLAFLALTTFNTSFADTPTINTNQNFDACFLPNSITITFDPDTSSLTRKSNGDILQKMLIHSYPQPSQSVGGNFESRQKTAIDTQISISAGLTRFIIPSNSRPRCPRCRRAPYCRFGYLPRFLFGFARRKTGD
jgi:hypothetical protein